MANRSTRPCIAVLAGLLVLQVVSAVTTVIKGATEAEPGVGGTAWQSTIIGGSPSSLPVSGSKIKYNFRIDNNGGTSLDTQGAISIDVVDAANQSIAPDAVVCTVGSPATSIAVNVGRVFTNPTGRAFGTSTEEVATCSFTVTVSAAQAQAGVMPQYNVKVALKVQGGVDSAALDSAVPLDAAFAAVKVYSGSVITVTYAVSTSSLTNGDYVTVGNTNISTSQASYTYTVTLTNGAKLVPASVSVTAPVYLKLTVGAPQGSTAPAIIYTCNQGSTFTTPLGTNAELNAQLDGSTQAAPQQVKCTFDVPVAALDVAAGFIPISSVTASWISDLSTGALVDEALYIPPVSINTAPVYSGGTISVSYAIKASDVTAGNNFTVGTSYVATSAASYTYTVTLTNGAKPVPASSAASANTRVYLKLTVGAPQGLTAPAITYTCNMGSTFNTPLTSHELGSQLDASTQAVPKQIRCTFDVPVAAAHVTAGAIPINLVTASWVRDTASTVLVDEALYIPPASVNAAPVYTGSTLTVSYAVKTSDLNAGNNVTVGNSYVPTSAASYTYTVTLTNGAKPVPASNNASVSTSVFLKLTVGAPQGLTAPAITYTCGMGSGFNTPLAGNQLGAQLDGSTQAAPKQVRCTFDVPVASHVAAGAVPINSVSASWVRALAGNTLVDEDLYIPPATINTAPIYTGNTLTIGTPLVDTTNSSTFIDVDGKPLVRVDGSVRYPISITIGRLAIPQPTALTFTTTTAGISFTVSSCTSNSTGARILPSAATMVNFTSTSVLAVGQTIMCELVATVTAAQRIAGEIAAFDLQATFIGAAITAAGNADALFIPASRSTSVEVFKGIPTWRLSRRVTSQDQGSYRAMGDIRYPLLGAEVTYTVILINADTPYQSLNIAVATTGNDHSYPTSVTTCKVGSTSNNLPGAALAANTALVCSFAVKVNAAHVAARILPSITVTAKNGSVAIATVVGTNTISGLPIFTSPSMTVAHDLGQAGTAATATAPIDHTPFGKMAVSGTRVTYTVTFRNGYAAVSDTTTFILSVTGITPLSRACRDIPVFPAAGAAMAISSEELFTCTFTYDVLADDVTAGRTPEITIKAQLDPPGDDPVQDVATAVYPGVEVFSSPVVRVKIASIDDFEPVNAVNLARLNGNITWKVALINAGATSIDANVNNLNLVITSADTSMPTTLTACTTLSNTAGTMPLTVALSSRAALVCDYKVMVTSAHAAVNIAKVPSFTVTAQQATVTTPVATLAVPETRVYTEPAVSYTMNIHGSRELVNNITMARELGTVTYTFSLHNGAVAVPSTTEVILQSNSSQFTRFISCTTSSSSQPFEMGQLRGLAAYNRLQCILERQVTAGDIEAGSYPAFTVRALLRDTTKYAPESEGYAAINVPALELFTGIPCKTCKACLAQMFDFAQPLLGETDAKSISTQFNTLCRQSRETAICQNITGRIEQSTNGNLGKRAGLLCTLLSECEPDRFESDCSLGSSNPLLSTNVPHGKVDLCKPQGTSTGTTLIPGVEATVNYTTGTCLDDTLSGCPATQRCDSRPGLGQYVCVCNNATGQDTCERRYPCVDTDCTICSTCMRSMRDFVALAAVRTAVIPQQVADAFRSHCSSAKYDATTCSLVAQQIADSFEGNLGKRPGWLCQQLGGCPRNISTLPSTCNIVPSTSSIVPNITAANFGLCTMDGLATGALVSSPNMFPNSSSPWPAGTCYAASGAGSCNATLGQLCTYAANRQFCTCDPATGRDVCRAMGECVTIGCAACNLCIQRTSSWIATRINVNDATLLATDWSTHCSSIPGTSASLCDSVKTAILSSHNGNLAKRAGNLCSRLNLCSPAADCAINVTNTNSSAAPFSPMATLDLCTIEGITRGNFIPGVLGQGFDLPSRIPTGNCYLTAANTPSSCPANYRCDITTVKSALCKCETTDAQNNRLATVSDTCLKYFDCVRTPCKVCSDCIGDMAKFAEDNQYALNRTILGQAFGEYCAEKNYPKDVCTQITDNILDGTRTLASAKRAGSLCVALGQCDPTSFEPGCMLSINSTRSVNASTFDQCTMQGVASGDDVPGFKAAGDALPAGRCDNDKDCGDTDVMMCKRTPETLASVCTCYKGQDTCRSLGVCVKRPCPGCQDCLKEFVPFVDSPYTQESTVAGLELLFASRCNRSAVICQAAKVAIVNSYNGNAGRRAGSICRLLGECDQTAMEACNLTVTSTPSPFSLCTKEGVVSGSEVAAYPINTTYTLPAGKCVTGADCNTAGGYECKYPMPGQTVEQVCHCNAATGRDVCTPIGTCTLTPCQECQNCLDVVNPVIKTELNKNESIPNPRIAPCNEAQTKLSNVAPTFCDSIKTKYLTAEDGKSTGYFGLRAAVLCSALGKCVKIPATGCDLKAEVVGVNKTGALDLCTAEGIVGGSAVQQDIPAGACLKDADCSSDMQCNRANTTNKVNKCMGGVDSITFYGACVAKPPPRTEIPPCTRCSDCITAFRTTAEVAALNASAKVSVLSDAFYAACSKAQFSLTACRDVSVLIAASNNGNLARRAGALCARLGECSPALSTDASCTITTNSTTAVTQTLAASSLANSENSTNATAAPAPAAPAPAPAAPAPAAPVATTLTGRFDACTIEGVNSGGMILGTYKFGQVVNNTCVFDSDCSAGRICSSANRFPVCRCMNGIDTCDTFSTCLEPAAPKPVEQKTPCQKCGECLANVAPFVNAIDLLGASADSKNASASFMTRCVTNLTENDVLACKPVADAMFYDIRLARRGGAICQRLGLCSPELTATTSTCNMTVGTRSGRLNLCSKEGVGATSAAAAVTFNSTHCRTDADCRNGTRFTGSVCSFDSGLSAVVRQIESCSNGVDTITRTGSCIDFCSTQQAYVDSMNTRVNQYACSGPYADCGTGMSCKASSLCNKLACANATVGIVTVPCYGFCVASEREILSAKMSNDGKSITAALNTAAAPGTFPCAAVFVGSTMEKLGYDAQCFVSSESAQSKVLVITLGPQSTFMPEVDTLSVSDTQRLLVDILNTKERFTGASIPVAKCAGTDCTGATAALFGPKSVPVPCDEKTARDVIFDASLSSDTSGRPLSKVYWELTAGGPDVVLSAAIDKANLANGGNGAYRLIIPGSQIVNMPGTDYTIQVTVKNFLGATNSKSWAFTKKISADTPVVSIPSGLTISYKIADGFKVPVALSASSVCGNQQVVYSWQPVEPWSAIPAGYNKKDLVIPGPVPGVSPADHTRVVTLTAKFDKSAVESSINVTLRAMASPLQAALRGPWGDTRNDRDIVLSAAASRDPDDPQGSRPLGVRWECVRADFPAPCFTGANSDGIQDGLTWTIPANTLADGIEHTIKATVYRTSANGAVLPGADNTASSFVSFTPRSAVIPTGRIRRMCGSNQCPAAHSADSSLIVTLVPDAGSESATVTWSSEQVPTVGAVTGKDWIIPASQLPKSGSITVKAALRSSSSNSTTSLTIPINGKPTCTKETGCIAVDATTGVFPDAKFTAEAVGFIDDQPGLRFDFGTLTASETRKVIASGPTPTYTFTGLPVGDVWLYVCALDSEGAKACSQTMVTVTEPSAEDFKVADALATFDVGSLVGTGDMSVLASGAQALQSLSEFANKPDVAATKSDAEREQVQKTIAAKTSSMISTLAENADDYINDPETMQQVVSAVATLAKTSNMLSQDTKDKMLDVADSGIAAAKLKDQPLNPAEASRLWAVVAAGNDLEVSCKVPGSCDEAAKVARRLLGEMPAWLDVNTIYSRSLLESAAVVSPVYAQRRLQQANETASPAPANTSSPSPSPSPSPAAAPAATVVEAPVEGFVPAYAAQAKEIGNLLAQGTGPAAYMSGGDNGLYLSVANYIGRNYEQWSVVSGPALDDTGNQADAASGVNAKLKFSKPLVASCVDEDGNAIGTSATCPDVVVPVRLTYLPDAAPLIKTPAPAAVPASRKLQAVGERTIVSGAATVEVDGDSKSALPCDSCTGSVSIPIWEHKEEWMLYDCGKIEDGAVNWGVGAVSGGVEQVGTPAVPTVTCTVGSAGSYIIGKRVDPNRPAGTPEEDKPTTVVNLDGLALGQPLKYSFKLAINETLFGSINEFLKDEDKKTKFAEDVKVNIADSFKSRNFQGITKDNIEVIDIRKGSIAFDVLIDTKGITNLDALKSVANFLSSVREPEDLFSPTFISTYGVTGITVQQVEVEAPAATTNLAAIIGGVVGGAGGAIIIAVVAFFIIRRRRMGGVEPRGTGNRGLLNGADHSA